MYTLLFVVLFQCLCASSSQPPPLRWAFVIYDVSYFSPFQIVDYELENLSLDFGDELGMFEPERPQLNSVPYTLEPINGYKQHYVPFDQRDRVHTN